jgi:hypothetical protein
MDIYDAPNDRPQSRVTGPLAAEAKGDFRPNMETDVFTIWNAAGPGLREVLNRTGQGIECPELGTRFAA